MTNRGVYPPSGIEDGQPLIHAFDYYRATIAASLELVLQTLELHLEAEGTPVTRMTGPSVRYYAGHTMLVDRMSFLVASVFSGGQNGRPNVEAKGAAAPAIADCIRANWSHRPSRVDPKCDMTGPDLYVATVAVALDVAAKHGLRKRHIDNHDPDLGNTFYLGARASQSIVRIYQPGLKRAAEEGRTGDQITFEERNAVRIEHEFKPQKSRAKLAAATMDPRALWAVSPWLADFAGRVFAMDVQSISIAERRESNRDRALRFMASQYSSHLGELLRDMDGDYAAFGERIAELAGIERNTH
jgi:hypothetical protein